MTTENRTVLHLAPQLSIGDAETLAAWFLYHMDMDLRHRLMASLPTVYARVYPGVDPDAIMSAVRAEIAGIQRDQTGAFAAMARAGQPYGEADRASLRAALRVARDLTEPDDPNGEYIRGQVNLIVDTFGLYAAGSGGVTDECQAIVTSVILREITVEAGLSELAALTGVEV